MTGYSVKIREASKELTKKQRVMIKDTSDAIRLDSEVNGDGLLIKPDYFVVLDVHNENSENVDYVNYIIVDTDGKKYLTSSEAFWSTFSDIWDEMTADDFDEEWELKCYKLNSKKYTGKQFLTCSVV